MPAQFFLTWITLAASLLFGGAARQGVVSDAIPELLALPLLALLTFRARHELSCKRTSIVMASGLVMLPLLQLIPLPVWLWTALPGRQIIVETLSAAGVPLSPRPLSLLPSMTLRALLSLIPIIAVFLSVAASDPRSRMRLLVLIVAFAAGSVLLAMLQLLGGQTSELYFFAVTNSDKGVGFFANANHFAALEYSALPLAAAYFANLRRRRSPPVLLAAVGFAVLLIIGLTLSGSRAALGFGVLAVMGAVGIVLAPEVGRLGRWRSTAFFIAGIAVLGPLLLGLGLFGTFERILNVDAAQDARWKLAPEVLASVRVYMPVGAGVGVFPAVFSLHESVANLTPEFVNRAHDDALEVAFEGGVASLILSGGFAAWFGTAVVDAFIQRDAASSRQARAGLLVMGLLLLHSLVDYPLRTIALGCVFAFCAALQFSPAKDTGPAELNWSWRRKRRRRRSRHRTSTPAAHAAVHRFEIAPLKFAD